MTIDLKQQILSVATDLFMNQGYAGTSTRQIAHILNITQPAIYHHFKNKEMLYTAVLTDFAMKIGLSLNQILSKDLPARETLVEMSLYLQQNHPMNLSLMMHDIKYSLTPETETTIFNIWRTHYFSPFIRFFESLKSELLPEFNSMIVSQHFLRILSSYISDSYQNDTISAITIEDMVAIFLRGVTYPLKSN